MSPDHLGTTGSRLHVQAEDDVDGLAAVCGRRGRFRRPLDVEQIVGHASAYS